jgi:hypothetical protein
MHSASEQATVPGLEMRFEPIADGAEARWIERRSLHGRRFGVA